MVGAALLSACGGSDASMDAGPDAGMVGDAGVPIDAAPDASSPDGGGEPSACEPDALPGPIEDGAWDSRFTISGFTGHDGVAPAVHDLALDPEGRMVATGRFQFFGEARVAPLLRREGEAWTAARESWELEPELSGFGAIAIASDGATALATMDVFRERRTEIWVDDGAGLRVVAHLDGVVRSLAWFEGALWAAGPFVIDEGGVANLAVWDGASWSAPPGGAADLPAYELHVHEGALYVGGAFASVGGIAAERVAVFDGSSWTARNGLVGDYVFALAHDAEGQLFAGGSLPDGETVERGGLYRWTDGAWALVGEGLANGPLHGMVADLALHDGDLYLTGCFTHVNGAADAPEAVPAMSVARWTGSEWASLDDGDAGVHSTWHGSWACGDEGPLAIFDANFQRLASDGQRLYVAGAFPGVDGVQSQSIVAYEDGAWVAQGEPGDGFAGFPRRLAVGASDCSVYGLGTTMSHAGGAPLEGAVVRWSDGWEPVPGALPRDLDCSDLAVDRAGRIFVGCSETMPSGPAPLGRVLRLDGDAWVEVAELPGPVNDIELDDEERLWVVGGAETGFLARIEGDALEVIEDDIDAFVWRLALEGDHAVIGGGFTSVGGVEATRIARWDGETWSALGDGMPGTPTAIAIDGDVVYSSCGDEGAGGYGFARFEAGTWTDFATAEHGVPFTMAFSVTSILVRGELVLVAGSIMTHEGDRPRGVLVFDGETLEPLDGGVGAISIDSVVGTADALWLSGPIGQVGPDGEERSSVGVARFVWPD